MNLLLDLFDQNVRSPEVEAAVGAMASSCETGRGAVFTRPDVVCGMLDLCGYVAGRNLHELRVLEPSFGAGSFLFPIVDRLLDAFGRAGGTPDVAVDRLRGAVRGVELHEDTYAQTFAALRERLIVWGLTEPHAQALCSSWLLRDDFLLAELEHGFDFVLGNPPYVRQERIPAPLLAEYRRRYATLFDRADLYVPFYERGLDLLATDGVLGYICANRWMKNRYGGPLREKIAAGYWLRYVMDLETVSAFDEDVIAYPAITIIAKGPSQGPTRIVGRTAASSQAIPRLFGALRQEDDAGGLIEEVPAGAVGSAPLLLDELPRLAVLRRIERQFPAIEQAGCRVGIGVATGCDRVYIGALDGLPVEPERKLPLVMAGDLRGGGIAWGGKGVLNPFASSGELVPLDEWPRFRAYLEQHREAVAGRNVAQRNADRWYRTIDRIQPGLLETPKILVPDIKGEGVFVIDDGHYYPHHNLYYITSSAWDLRALQAVLRSSMTLLTIASYCTRMSGGFLRFQAQYLRRIRIPRWRDVGCALRERLVAVTTGDQQEIDAAVFELYGLTTSEATLVAEGAAEARVAKARS